MIDKNLVLKRFKKSIFYYNETAFVQKAMADNLMEMIVNKAGKSFRKIFEIGCGSGLLTQIAAETLSFESYYANDLVLDSEKIIKEWISKAYFLEGDAEAIVFPGQMDLILSGATFQWFEDLKFMLEKCAISLNPNGILAFSTFGSRNFKEISGITGFSLNYKDWIDFFSIGQESFQILDSKQEIQTLYFNEPMDVLKHIHKTGVNGNSHELWSRSDFSNFIKKYQAYYQEGKGYSLTYEPYYFIMKRAKICR